MRKFTVTLWLIALFVLAGSFSFFVYSVTPKGDTDKVIINGKDYYWDDICDDFKLESFEAGETQYTGISLTELAYDAGIGDPETKKFTIAGADGYQKTLDWDDFSNGYLVKEKKLTVFPDLTKSFWVRDVIEIKAK